MSCRRSAEMVNLRRFLCGYVKEQKANIYEMVKTG